MNQCGLRESDILGGSLNGRKPEDLKVVQLKQWLDSRAASTKGKKADLISRFQIETHHSNVDIVNVVNINLKCIILSQLTIYRSYLHLL